MRAFPVMIPSLMHQIFIGGDLGEALQRNVEEHRRRNPEWHHMFWTESAAEAFVAQHYGNDMLRSYSKIDARYGAARADLLRHLVIYKLGGVYFDIKSVFERPLSSVLRPNDRYLLAQWDNGERRPRAGYGLHRDLQHVAGGEYLTHFIIAEPDHLYTKTTIERIVRNIEQYKPWHSVGRNGVLRTTGPIAYTLAVESVRNERLHRRVTEKDIGIKLSLERGYDHQREMPKRHYSELSLPIVPQSPFGSLISRGVQTGRYVVARLR